MNLQLRSRRRKENCNSKIKRHEAKQRNGSRGWEARKRHRAAALQDLADGAACNPSRQRLGVRQPYAALTFVCWQAEFLQLATFSRFNVLTLQRFDASS